MAFLLPFFICLGICIGNGVYPFGENCILHVDMYHQYCPFFTEFLEKLQNGGSLLYSWNLGLGSDFVSLYAYYLASPFNWLLILCPKAFVIEFMTLLVLTKTALCGLSFFLYLKHHEHLVGKDGRLHGNTFFPALVCSAAYALSGFVATYNWNIMWMDCVALAPLIILGLERLVKEKKAGLYYGTLALAIVSNYYISIMICLFVALYFIVLFFRQKTGRAGAFWRFSLYSLLAGGSAAVLLIPEYIILGASGSQGISFPETVEWYFDLIGELSRSCMSAYVYTGREHWPNLYSGVFAIFCVVLFFLNRRISWKKKLPCGAMLFFFWIGFANNYLDFIWHGLHFPDSLPGRQSFLYSFLVLVMSFETVIRWRGNRLWHAGVAFLFGAVPVFLGTSRVDAEIVDPFAFLATGIFLGVYTCLFVLHAVSKKKLRSFYRKLTFVIAICELTVNMAVTGFSVTSRTAYTEKQKDYETLIQAAEEANAAEGGGFYRVEDPERMTKNDDMRYGYPSGTQFSSLMNIEVSHFYQSVLMEGGKNFYCYNGATPLLSAMLSVKYRLSDNSLEEGPLQKIVAQSGNSVLYESTYSLPLGFMMPEEAVEAWDNSSTFKIDNINALGSVLGASEPMLEKADCLQQNENGKTTITVNEDGYYYAVYDHCSSDTLTEHVTDGRSRTFSKTTHRYLLELGYSHFGDEITLSNTQMENMSYTVYKLNLNAVAQAYETLAAQTMTLTAQTDTKVEGTIDVREAGRLVFSIPAESRWKLYVDGKETPATDFKNTFISVYLPEGNHTISLRYETPGLWLGAGISAACIALAVILLLCHNKRSACRTEWRDLNVEK